MAQTLLFDLDGTLVDSLPDIAASTNHLRRQFGLAELDLQAVAGMVGDGLLALLRQALAPIDKADAAALQDALAIYSAHHQTQCTDLVLAYPGVTEHLAQWHGEGCKLGVVTNKPADFAQRILDHLGLATYLPVVIGGDSTPARKPDPAPVQAALQQLDADPAEATMIGDSPADLLAGRAAGTRTAAVLYGYRSEAVLREVGADEYWPRFGGRDRDHRPLAERITRTRL